MTTKIISKKKYLSGGNKKFKKSNKKKNINKKIRKRKLKTIKRKKIQDNFLLRDNRRG